MTRPTSTLYRADALAVLPTLPSASVQAVVVDPPYSSGGLMRGDRVGQSPASKYQQHDTAKRYPTFSGDNRDQRSWGYWSALWLGEALRVAAPGAPILMFCDWRQLPTATDALQAGGWVWRGIAVWDKTEGARPQRGRFRAQSEFIAWGSAGPMPPADGVPCLPGVFRVPVRQAGKHHLTGKPVELMTQLLAIVPPGSAVLDLFMGSGSTGVAAARLGLDFIGCEIDAVQFGLAETRLQQGSAERHLDLFSALD